MKKQCTKCKLTTDNFGPSGNRGGSLASWCRICKKHYGVVYRRTKEGLLTKIYGDQVSSSKKRKHDKPEYSLEQLRNWVLKQDKFHELYDNWQASGYEKMLIPSCDRLNNSVGYHIGNLEVVTWQENHCRAGEDQKVGKLNTGTTHKPVEQLTTEGEVIARFLSQAEAGRFTGVDSKNIGSVCSGRCGTAGGFRWRHT